MISSRNCGPTEVQDLSEHLGKARAACSFNLQAARMLTPKVSPTSVGPLLKSLRIRQDTLDSNGSHTLHEVWKGARFSRVRGSIPPAIISGLDPCTAYITHKVQRLNTVAEEQNCGNIRYYTYAT